MEFYETPRFFKILAFKYFDNELSDMCKIERMVSQSPHLLPCFSDFTRTSYLLQVTNHPQT